VDDRGSVRAPTEFDPVAGGFRAVQGDTSGTCVDWRAFHAWQADDPGFAEVVTVLDDHGGQLTMVNWPSPTDLSADRSVERMGWQRVGSWAPDRMGRRGAAVRRDPAFPQLTGRSAEH